MAMPQRKPTVVIVEQRHARKATLPRRWFIFVALFVLALILIGLAIDRARAEPLPQPKPPGPGGSCPFGYTSSGSYCVLSQGAQDAVPKPPNGTCPFAPELADPGA